MIGLALCSVGWIVGWLADWSAGWSVGRSVGWCLTGLLIDRLVGWLAGWLLLWLVGCWVAWLVNCSGGCLFPSTIAGFTVLALFAGVFLLSTNNRTRGARGRSLGGLGPKSSSLACRENFVWISGDCMVRIGCCLEQGCKETTYTCTNK